MAQLDQHALGAHVDALGKRSMARTRLVPDAMGKRSMARALLERVEPTVYRQLIITQALG